MKHARSLFFLGRTKIGSTWIQSNPMRFNIFFPFFFLSQACVNFYRDALLLEDFAMLNYTAVIKLLKKRDKVAGTRDQRFFMAEVMADQPFAM